MEVCQQMPSSAARRTAPLPAVVDPIEEGLRELFRTMVEEPLPDEFKALLERIDAATPRAGDPAAAAAATGDRGGDAR